MLLQRKDKRECVVTLKVQATVHRMQQVIGVDGQMGIIEFQPKSRAEIE